jgi:glucose-1-phosphate thymidylyltransferase
VVATGDGRRIGARRLYYAYQEGEGGIADALARAEPFAAHDSVCVILGDNLFECDFRPQVARFEQISRGARILLKEVPDPQRFGVAEVHDDRVVRIVEKPADPPSNYAVVGAYFYDRHVFDIIQTLKPSGRGELEITDVNNHYLQRGELSYDVVAGWWADAGTPESLLRASNLVAGRT